MSAPRTGTTHPAPSRSPRSPRWGIGGRHRVRVGDELHLSRRRLQCPMFGLLANLGCMIFYLIGPFMGFGTVKEPLLALGIALIWAIYGAIYFVRSSKAKGRTTLVGERGMGALS